jgi:uncharacterized repeat protein (TIGR03847 family)
MARELELDPVDFITIGTVGPKGKRVFHLQAGREAQIVTLTVEKEQARALSEGLEELLEELHKQFGSTLSPDAVELHKWNMDLREPIEPQFRVAQIGLGYNDERDMVVLVAQEVVIAETEEEVEGTDPQIVRLWCTRQQMRALGLHTGQIVKQGRVDPQSNGQLLYYWT